MRGEETPGYAPEEGETDAEMIRRLHSRLVELMRRTTDAAGYLRKK